MFVSMILKVLYKIYCLSLVPSRKLVFIVLVTQNKLVSLRKLFDLTLHQFLLRTVFIKLGSNLEFCLKGRVYAYINCPYCVPKGSIKKGK